MASVERFFMLNGSSPSAHEDNEESDLLGRMAEFPDTYTGIAVDSHSVPYRKHSGFPGWSFLGAGGYLHKHWSLILFVLATQLCAIKIWEHIGITGIQMNHTVKELWSTARVRGLF